MKKKRLIYAALFLPVLLAEILIALFVKDAFVRPYVGDMLVTVLICCFLRIFFPTGVKMLTVYVFLFAASVEFGQYLDMVKLLGLENNTFFSVLLGRTFSLADILGYAGGGRMFFGAAKTVNYFVN
ncbi:MAG: DUF2809 domain-containing protein [Clostridia bacterium]|nr:DUF2809 domain-containing protein [Clostridia bacterium]